MGYTKIVVAVDLGDDAKKVLSKAINLLKSPTDQLHLIHVIEPIPISPGYDLTPALPLEWDDILRERAEDFLKQLIKEIGKDNIKMHVRIGSVKGEIFSMASEVGADLIVLGTHGRHGIGLLLGSTATAVIHGTPCDVLAVRVNEST